MSTIDTIGSRHSKASSLGVAKRPRIFDLLPAAMEAISVMMERRRSRLVLLGLTDHELKDIGISRADAEREGLRKPWEDGVS